jgi:hypothetical protein
MRKRDSNELARLPLPARGGENGRAERLVLGVVEEAARVVQQLTERDRRPVWNEAR